MCTTCRAPASRSSLMRNEPSIPRAKEARFDEPGPAHARTCRAFATTDSYSLRSDEALAGAEHDWSSGLDRTGRRGVAFDPDDLRLRLLLCAGGIASEECRSGSRASAGTASNFRCTAS